MPETKKYAFIDALRGIAILGVLMVHTSKVVFSPSSPWLLKMSAEATHGVQLFYMISAFTLLLSYQAGKTNYTTLNFLLRRFFRIAPLFYLAVITYLWIDGLAPRYWAPDGIKWWYILTSVTFTNAWYPTSITSVVPGGWSVAIEMNFYLLLPFCFKYVTSLNRAVFFTLMALLLNLIFAQIMLPVLKPLFPEEQRYLVFFFLKVMCLPAQMGVFGLGFVLYFLFIRIDQNKKMNSYLYVAVSLYIMLALFNSKVHLSAYDLFPHHFIYGIAFLFLAYALSIYPLPIFVNRITQKIGKVSYSLYLTHGVVLYGLKKITTCKLSLHHDLQFLFYYLLMIVLTYGLSLLTYQFVEKPGMALGRRIISR